MSRPRPGDVFGTVTVIRKVNGKERWRVRCSCGREQRLGMSALAARATGKNEGCTSCSWERSGSGQRKLVTLECEGCGERVTRYPSGNPIVKCPACKTIVDNANLTARRHATTGRVCVGCGRPDAETNWSQHLRRCQGCDRTGHRNGWCPCGAPLWSGGVGRTKSPMRCRAGCGDGGMRYRIGRHGR